MLFLSQRRKSSRPKMASMANANADPRLAPTAVVWFGGQVNLDEADWLLLGDGELLSSTIALLAILVAVVGVDPAS